MSVQTSVYLPFTRVLVITFRGHPDNPGQFLHLKTFNLMWSAKLTLPYEVKLARSKD